MTSAVHVWNGLRVPWITPWSSEQGLPVRLVRQYNRHGEERIGYADEDRSDRRDGVLWVRIAVTPGTGVPDFASLHPLRQRQAMAHLLCQVCGTPTVGSRADERHLFLVREADGRPLREGQTTIAPPVHETCALQSVRACPHLRRGWTAALVGHASPWGIAGTLHHPDTLAPLSPPRELIPVPYEDEPRLHWLLASREVVALHEVEPIGLDRLETEARTVQVSA
ncbi:hypothetical protein PV682_23300 [Streptomyces niveiscabiei]|uniref:hypothetical protein n=1 Tax=Streptomyces niveiscabiei TaxID=164115 RepID=UPI0029BAB0ED|nr:hypothetical protein [Streptomyces niveiscabiei]MDX3384369.1 hypothetical protein [Streptomyces niveiscabiei]